MSRISIDKPLAPGQKITFSVDMSFFGYSRVEPFTITVPRAAPLLSKVNNIIVTNKKGPEREKIKGNYAFDRYVKGESLNANFYVLKVRLVNPKNANELSPGDIINLNSNDPKLAALKNKNYTIIRDNNKNKSYVSLRVNKTDQPTVASGTVTSSSLQEIVGTVKTRRYTVTLPKKVFDGLVTERDITKANATKGMVEDIPIFAFKRFQGKDSASIKKKLMNSFADISEREPPDRSNVVEFIGKPSYTKEFVINDEDKFIFYVSIARYIYNGNNWDKEWLQKNVSRLAIWGKAVERK